MIEDIIGPHGLKYFPVVMSFAVLILVSNLMGLFPLFMSPTSAVSVTFAARSELVPLLQLHRY
jgi:F-type H+-transporting ATPase subunit a